MSEHYQLIQQRYDYITNELQHNNNYKQVSSITLSRLKHLTLSTPYTYNIDQSDILPTSSYIDHTVLKPDATYNDIQKLCNEAIEYKFASVCVNSSRVAQCKELLNTAAAHICSVVGFPLGATTTEAKIQEAKQALHNGAKEIDMVINIGYLLDNDYDTVYNDIVEVVRVCNGYIVKVIIETSLLTIQQIIDATILVALSGAQYVKTSTGFSTGGATIQHVKLMKTIVGNSLYVKASGGIRDYTTACNMILAGANRLGCSAGVSIVKGEQQAKSGQTSSVSQQSSINAASAAAANNSY